MNKDNLNRLINDCNIFKNIAKGSVLPLLANKDNILISKQGEISYSYQLIPKDFEQLSFYEVNKFYNHLKSYLNRVQNGVFFKIISIDNKIYLNTNLKESNLPYCKSIPLENPLKILFGYRDLYSNVSHGSDFLKFNNQYLKIINFLKLNEDEIDEEELGSFGDYIIQFEKRNSWMIRQMLEVKRNLLLHNLLGFKRNIKSEKAYSDIEEVMSDIIDGKEMIFMALPSILIRTDDYHTLSQKTHLILRKLEERGHIPIIETDGLKYFFENMLFGIKPSFKFRSHELVTSYLVNLLPASSDYLMDKGLELESISGTKLYYDIFDSSDNYNVWICGPSGKGKSYLAQHIQDYYIEQGIKILILEYGKSHDKLCSWHQGVPYNGKVNFLQFKNPHYLKDLILNITGREKNFSEKMEQGRLFEVIEKGLKENLFINHEEFINYLENNFKGIKYYFTPIREYLTDDYARRDSSVVYCDIKDYSIEMRAPMIVFLFEWFKSWEGRKIFVLEEVTKFVKENFQSEVISDFARDKRKEGGSILTITQHINDTLRYPFLDVIFENSEHKILFEHDSEIKVELNPLAKELIQELGKEEQEKREFSEFVLSRGTINKIARLRRDNLKYEIFTSNQIETSAFNRYEKENGSGYFEFRDRMKHYVEYKYGK